jgi:predicted RecA/RadA family phage recombinase
MAVATKIHSDPRTIPYTPGSAVAAGDVVVVGATVGIAPAPIAANAAGTLEIEGEFYMPKAAGSSTAIGAGVKVWWDATNSVVTTTSSTHKAAGYTSVASVDADTTQRVILARA